MSTTRIRHTTGYIFMAVFAIFISLYPLKFIWTPTNVGLLGSKAPDLLDSALYLPAFYLHIFPGGLALLSGFSQFFPKLRKRQPGLHRFLGKTYMISVLLSGTSALGIAFFATGGIISALGFGALAVLWLFTTSNAYLSIRRKDITEHQKWMIRSYALCFAAVTLRIYLPTFTALGGMDFIPAYKMIAWLCWVPNILVAEYLIIRKLPGSGIAKQHS